MAWIYLLIAALFEIAWTFSMKFLSVKKIGAIKWQELFSRKENLLILAPLAGYILFGLGNVFFFSMAMKEMSASTALAVWMGFSLIGVKLMDITLFKESFGPYQFLYIALIIIGIIGLRKG